MSWLSKILNCVPKSERIGLELDLHDAWQLEPVSDGSVFLRALPALRQSSAVLYLEGTTERAVADCLKKCTVEPTVTIAPGTIWPRPDIYHVPMSGDNLEQLACIVDDKGVAFLAFHVHVYTNGEVVLQWHDAFERIPLYVSSTIDENRIKDLAGLLGVGYSRLSRAGDSSASRAITKMLTSKMQSRPSPTRWKAI